MSGLHSSQQSSAAKMDRRAASNGSGSGAALSRSQSMGTFAEMRDYPREADEDEWEATVHAVASPGPASPAKRRSATRGAAGGKPCEARSNSGMAGEERPAIWDVFGSTENGKK